MRTGFVLLLLASVTFACKKDETPAPARPAVSAPMPPAPAQAAPAAAAAPAGGYTVTQVTGGGSIMGTVKWTGPVPKLPDLAVAKDQSTCGSSVKNPRLVVGPAGGVGNTYVYLADIHSGAALPPKEGVLDQKACEYRPHVQVMSVGSKFIAQNSDPILHSVHTYNGVKTIFNFAQPIQGQKSEQVITKPGVITVKCDAGHLWMNAIVHVAEHPYHALTGDDGKFEIKDVPPGKYQLVAWHEGWKTTQTPVAVTYADPVEIKKDVTVETGKPASVNFELKE
jgi:hypothetical protein